MLDVRNIKMLNTCKCVIWETEEDDNEVRSLALTEASGCTHCPCFTEKETEKVSELGQAQAHVFDSVASTLTWMDMKGENREGSGMMLRHLRSGKGLLWGRGAGERGSVHCGEPKMG